MAILAFSEDFTSSVQLDSELTGAPDSGLYWNRGVHPVCTVDNLLSLLPSLTQTFAAYAAGTTYGKFETSRKRSDVVTYNSKIYQSIAASNIGHQPDTSPLYWLETNLESIKIKAFLWSVNDNVTSALALNRKLIENQYIYSVGSQLTTLTGDYSGWAFEPKGSDYVKIRINQLSLQANTTDQVSLYVVNQGVLKHTLTLNPNNGILEFEQIGYTFSGKGPFYFVFESQEVKADGIYNDPLKYDGFVCYTVSGTGATPQAATYSENSQANGLNFNISCYLDSSVYIENNAVDFAKFYQSQFEMDFVKMATLNVNAESNREQRNLNNDRALSLLATEGLNSELNTVAKNYLYQRKQAIEAINRTFDKFLHSPKGFTVNRKTL